VAWDISHIKQMERARADFMHALSHDMKSPISAIKGWTELIERGNGHGTDIAKFTDRIRHTADTTLAMIDQLLDIASLNEAPRLHLAPCDLDEIVAKAISDVEGAATAKAIEIHLTLTGKPRRVMGDRSRLYRSTLNLLDNAIKYSPPNTSVSVVLNYRDGVELSICNGGPGIPEEDLPHVFEKFFRGVAAAGSIKGAGLGLATVQAAIEAHGGTITVRNSPDSGAEFSIKLPARAMMDAPSRTTAGSI
jgi:signal transduction histidine kinase